MRNNGLITCVDPKSPISEIFKTLRTNINFMDVKKQSKVFLITSTFAGEGKSWISSNLAVSFTQTGQRVLLIDADMRKGRQYKIFKVSPKPGLSNFLSEANFFESENISTRLINYIQKTKLDNLFIMTAGNIPPNPSELLNSSEMGNLINIAKNNFDVVIVDGTPMQLVADSLILARLVDATIIVTACKETKKEDLGKTINNIKNIGGNILGVVLNKVPISAKKYEQRYYYNSKDTTERDFVYRNNDEDLFISKDIINEEANINEEADINEEIKN